MCRGRPHERWSAPCPGLEVELRAELENARVAVRRDVAERRGSQRSTESVRIGVVPNVEGFASQLEPDTILAERDVLEEREIPALVSGSPKDAAPFVSGSLRTGPYVLEAGRVVPLGAGSGSAFVGV